MRAFLNKKWLIISFIGLVLLAAIIWYTIVPIRFERVLPTSKAIEQIDFGVYADGMDIKTYNNKIKRKNEINPILSSFHQTSFRRVVGQRESSLNDKFLSFTLFDQKGVHFVDINEKGTLHVDQKTYKVTKHHQKLFQELMKNMTKNNH